jgi:hypothetical protein
VHALAVLALIPLLFVLLSTGTSPAIRVVAFLPLLGVLVGWEVWMNRLGEMVPISLWAKRIVIALLLVVILFALTLVAFDVSDALSLGR